ncbi:DUF4389 domain-containing protein [Streptomyces tsukubensis]|uniref:DUF4389 domain-containing protein n=1 Tax=Streptomyces tsukubensis TaxID=83656 RepID=A0A1V4AA98_9ACTN|nr:DUF4389 domain-containing protein [Streptomyces tsukubensis]OON80560.1 hypothetical protein B1H18_11745 [Streptomyces tsukubensis]QFR96212.1 DUF4389 domain-containing protein [Streptomyces tsukubensis]
MSEPQWDPRTVPESPREWLPALDIPEPARQRRLTVLVRWLLLIPHFVVLFLLSVAVVFTAIAGWFSALVLGRLPEPIFRFHAGYTAYYARVAAASMLLVDRYPPFTLAQPEAFPVRFEVRPTPLNRLAVLFRVILAIPAAIIESVVTSGWATLSVIWWLITLALGRMPRPLFEATAATLRYHSRLSAYWLLLTPSYPKRFFGDDPESPNATAEVAEALNAGRPSATRPLLVSTGGTVLLVLLLVVGLLSAISTSSTTTTSSDDVTTVSHSP